MRFLPAIFILVVLGCQSKDGDKVTITLRGSESMHEPFDALKKDFEMIQDSIIINIEGGGSRVGLTAIKNDEVDIGLSSYNFNIDSIFGDDHGVEEKVVAYDGIVLINNENNPVDQLSNEQISKIYSGQYSDWSELGGEPGKILPIVRDQNSGTQKFFVEHFGVPEIAKNAIVAHENHEIVSKVLADPHGIGFIGFAYVTFNVKDISIVADSSENEKEGFVYPSFTSIQQGVYPLKRGLRVYYRGNTTSKVKSFLNYINSQRGQKILEKHGLICAPKYQMSELKQ